MVIVISHSLFFFGSISTFLFKDWVDCVYRGFTRHLFLATAENGAHRADWKHPPRICWIKSLHLDIIVEPLCWGFLKLLVKQISSILNWHPVEKQQLTSYNLFQIIIFVLPVLPHEYFPGGWVRKKNVAKPETW